VLSGGSKPADGLNPSVVAVLAERGLDAGAEFPKPITDEAARAADVIVTMGCGDACPVYPGTRVVDWELTDPTGLPVDAVRPIVDDIDRRVRALLDELLAGAPFTGWTAYHVRRPDGVGVSSRCGPRRRRACQAGTG